MNKLLIVIKMPETGRNLYRLPRLKYTRKIIAGPERTTNVRDVS